MTYKYLKRFLQPLLQEILFPLLSFTEDDQLDWDSDPESYIRNEYSPVSEYYSPQKNVEHFLLELFRLRSASNLFDFMRFVVSRLEKYFSFPSLPFFPFSFLKP